MFQESGHSSLLPLLEEVLGYPGCPVCPEYLAVLVHLATVHNQSPADLVDPVFLGRLEDLLGLEFPVILAILECPVCLAHPVFLEHQSPLGYLWFLGFLEDPVPLAFLEHLLCPAYPQRPVYLEFPERLGFLVRPANLAYLECLVTLVRLEYLVVLQYYLRLSNLLRLNPKRKGHH